MRRETLDALREIRRNRRSAALITDLVTNVQSLEQLDDAAGSLRNRTGIVESGQGEAFVHIFVPLPRLIVIGAVHIAQKLIPIAQLAGFSVYAIDPRAAFATADRFPGVQLLQEWPDKGLASLTLDSQTAVVTLSHDSKLDDPALITALRSPAFYIGALGSQKTQAKRRDRLRVAGFGEVDLERIRAPVGLPIGAVSPGEIAVAIMAEIVAARHGRTLQLVRE